MVSTSQSGVTDTATRKFWILLMRGTLDQGCFLLFGSHTCVAPVCGTRVGRCWHASSDSSGLISLALNLSHCSEPADVHWRRSSSRRSSGWLMWLACSPGIRLCPDVLVSNRLLYRSTPERQKPLLCIQVYGMMQEVSRCGLWKV